MKPLADLSPLHCPTQVDDDSPQVRLAIDNLLPLGVHGDERVLGDLLGHGP